MTQGQDATGAHVSKAEAARLAGVSRKTLDRWEASGKLSVDRSGSKPMIQVDELLRLGLLDRVRGGALGPATSVGHPAPVSQNDAARWDIEREAEMAGLRAENARLQDEVAWLRQHAEALQATVRLALPPARPLVEVEAQRPQAPGRLRRWWAWFVGRKEGG